MAKWGEGDPRWIVEERPDAKNVNNWHWTEKNATPWSRQKLELLLLGLRVEDPHLGFCKIDSITSIEGEASASNRKAKLIFFYEWVIEAEWTGQLNGDSTTFKGKIEIPNLSEENDASEIDVRVTTSSTSSEAYRLKEFMRIKGAEMIRMQLAQYMKSLTEEFSQDLILPTNKSAPKTQMKEVTINNPIGKPHPKDIDQSKVPVGVKIKTKTLKLEESFMCTPEELYKGLTQENFVSAWSQGRAVVKAVENGEFTLLEGNIRGKFSKLVANETLVMTWRLKDWPDEHYSTVTIELVQKDSETILKLRQTNVPENQYDKTKQGWKRYYFDAIKRYFGFGSYM